MNIRQSGNHSGVPKLWCFDLHVVSRSSPDIFILEICTNDLFTETTSLIAFSFEVLVSFLHDRFSVKVICVFRGILRRSSCAFNDKVAACNEFVGHSSAAMVSCATPGSFYYLIPFC